MLKEPRGEDVARLHGRNARESQDVSVTRTATGLEEVVVDDAGQTEPEDFDDVPAKKRPPAPIPNRAQRRAMSRWAKSPEGKKALARARAERKKNAPGKD